jgi:hypothetical protein
MAMQKMKVAEIYGLPGQEPLNEHCFRIKRLWFRELATTYLEIETQERIHARGRLVAKRVDCCFHGDDRSEELLTLWFDDIPFAVIREYGERSSRWVTDVSVFGKALAYITTERVAGMEDDDLSDFVPAEREYPVTVVFGRELGARFGVQREPLGEAGLLLVGSDVLKTLGQDEYLVLSCHEQPPELIRRDGWYARLVRKVNERDLAANPRIGDQSTTMFRKGYRWAFVYHEQAHAPEDFENAVAF